MDIDKELKDLKGWEMKRGKIQKVFRFENFLQGLGFVKKVAEIAESLDHHPDVLLTYRSVTLTISTHSENAVTEKDVEFARKVDEL